MTKRFTRPTAMRSYRKIFYLFLEGEETEPLYFAMIKRQSIKAHINMQHSNKKTTAKQILEKAKRFIREEKIRNDDEVWLVIDVDNNTQEDLQTVINWSEAKPNYGLALSNPKFEYWLLLHFEAGNKIKNQSDLEARLAHWMPNYEKSKFDTGSLFAKRMNAIDNARNRYQHCHDWYHDYHSTMFRLLEKILTIT